MASCSSPNDAIRIETAFMRHIQVRILGGVAFDRQSHPSTANITGTLKGRQVHAVVKLGASGDFDHVLRH
jgi:hypothetical protein